MKTIKVRAVRPNNSFGFYGGRRLYNGDEFDVLECHFSSEWMEKIKKKPGPKAKAKPEPDPEQEQGAE